MKLLGSSQYITSGGRSALAGTVTPGGITLASMDESLVALHDVVYDLGNILYSTCADTDF